MNKGVAAVTNARVARDVIAASAVATVAGTVRKAVPTDEAKDEAKVAIAPVRIGHRASRARSRQANRFSARPPRAASRTVARVTAVGRAAKAGKDVKAVTGRRVRAANPGRRANLVKAANRVSLANPANLARAVKAVKAVKDASLANDRIARSNGREQARSPIAGPKAVMLQ